MNLKKLIKNPYRIFSVLVSKGLLGWVSDHTFTRWQYRAQNDQWPDLENPKTFNEKLNWLKLYDRRPEYTMMVDKYLVRDYVAEKIGEEYLIPLLGVWDDPEEIDFDALPQQFVLKCNHTSGAGQCVCKDKSKLDIEQVKKELAKGLKQDYYKANREWPYKNVPRKIIAEKYIEDENGQLPDYKLMCYDGKVKITMLCSGRFTQEGMHCTYFGSDWKVLPFEFEYYYPAVKEGLPGPRNFEKMKQLAEKLAEGLPFVRVDFYEVGDKIYFGEMTLYPNAGFKKFKPDEWDLIQGQWITLPEEKVCGE